MLNNGDMRSALIEVHISINESRVSWVYVEHEPRKTDVWSHLNIFHFWNKSIVFILALKKLEIFEWMNVLLWYKYENEFYIGTIWSFTFLIL